MTSFCDAERDLRDLLFRILWQPDHPYSLNKLGRPLYDKGIIIQVLPDRKYECLLPVFGSEYKHRGPKPKEYVYVDPDAVRKAVNFYLPPQYFVLDAYRDRDWIVLLIKDWGGE